MRGKNDDYGWVWSTLATLFLTVFAVFETKAFTDSRKHGKPLGTLSYWTRKTIGLHPKSARRFILVPLFTIVWVWAGPHILWDLFNPPGYSREKK